MYFASFRFIESFLSLYYINLFKKAIYYALFIIFNNFGSFGQIIQFVFGAFSK